MNIHHTEEQSLLGKILFLTGTFSAGLTIADIDIYMSILFKFISLCSFVCYLLINQDQIKKGWTKFKNKFKR